MLMRLLPRFVVIAKDSDVLVFHDRNIVIGVGHRGIVSRDVRGGCRWSHLFQCMGLRSRFRSGPCFSRCGGVSPAPMEGHHEYYDFFHLPQCVRVLYSSTRTVGSLSRGMQIVRDGADVYLCACLTSTGERLSMVMSRPHGHLFHRRHASLAGWASADPPAGGTPELDI